jgi:hypothetical protein
VMHKRNITGGAILGAGLLGTLIALGQDSGPPRPRPIMPPPVSDVVPNEAPIVPKKEGPKTVTLPEPMPLPTFEPSTNPIQSIQHVEPNSERKKTAVPDYKDALPKLAPPPALLEVPPLPKDILPAPPPVMETPGTAKSVLPPPLPPVPSTSDVLPPPVGPPIGPTTPKVEVKHELTIPPIPSIEAGVKDPPKQSKAPETTTAPPKPWTPTDTPKAFPPAPAHTIIDTAPARPTPGVPVSNPPATGQEPSRFIAPPKSSAIAPLPAPDPNTPAPAAPDAPPAIRRFQPVVRPPVGNQPPAPLPKFTDVVRPTVPDLHAPAHDPVLGGQTAQLTIEKRGPLLHKLGGSMQYQIVLRNVGAVAAQNVRVEDEVPGAQLVAAIPVVTQKQDDRLIWMLPSLRPGEERTFVEELQPVRAGDVVSTTSVHVYASTSFRTKLEGDLPGPSLVTPAPLLHGQGPSLLPAPSVPTAVPFPPVNLMPNPALNPAPNPTPNLIPNPIPPALSPSAPISALPTSNSPALNPLPKQNPLPKPAGPMPMALEVKALPSVGLGDSIVFEVIVSNKGSTPLTKMMLYGSVPAGFSHPKATAEKPNIGADLPDLGPNETKTWNMPMKAVRPGRYNVEIRVTGSLKNGNALDTQTEPDYELVARPVVTVEAKAEEAPEAKSTNAPQADIASSLQLQVQGADNQVGEGKETLFQVRVTNTGGAVATNVLVKVNLTAGLALEPAHVQSRTAYRRNGNEILFAPIPRLKAGETQTITLGVRGIMPGQQSVRAQVVSDQLRTPISREDRTQVYRER